MNKILAILLAVCLLTGCAAKPAAEATAPPAQTLPAETEQKLTNDGEVTEILLGDDAIAVNGTQNEDSVYTSHDIVYYQDTDAYESGNPYGEGEAWERHSAEEAQAHTVVNITEPGTYRVSGKLSKGQIRVDLGENACEDPNAVVNLILKDADITCTVAPAILFVNVYECDGNWSVDTAKPEVDTSAAGANLILEGGNTVNGSHVAKIFKDQEEEKKLWKQDGAIYSYMSMNVSGDGKLDLTADNEGLDTELHLTINGGDIAIRADNDGINTNEDGVSVTTINAGNIHIIAGLGAEGDGIDSNGYLVINGGTVVAAANPGADAGMDSDLGSYIHGGTVIALGSSMDWAESDSEQVTMNLQFAENQSADAAIVVTKEDGSVLFAYDPGADEVLADNKRVYSGAILSCASFQVGESYRVYVDGEITGEDLGGIYDPATVTSYGKGTQMAYTGTDVMMRPGGMGIGGRGPENMKPNDGMARGEQPPEMPEGMEPGQRPQMPDDEMPPMPEDFAAGEHTQWIEMPEGFDPGQLPEGMEMPENGFMERWEIAQFGAGEDNTAHAIFYMQDKVNFFSGLTPAEG